jgi:deazaflavin-dependent oxidoreductase (nitroreductase family)
MPRDPADRLRGPQGARLKAGFRYVNRFMVELWRLGLGRWVNVWPRGSGRILVLGHTGRRSGLRRWTPLNYAEVDGHVYCTAGFGAGSDWYRNVLTDPAVEVWLPGRRSAGLVQEESGSPDRPRLLRQVLIASGFAARVAGLAPRRMADPELAAATAGYRLLRIELVADRVPLPDHPRPADHLWLLGLAGVLLACLGVARRRAATMH